MTFNCSHYLFTCKGRQKFFIYLVDISRSFCYFSFDFNLVSRVFTRNLFTFSVVQKLHSLWSHDISTVKGSFIRYLSFVMISFKVPKIILCTIRLRL